jgi:hypothetical protein
MGIEPMDAEVVETVAGVVRLPRRAAELAWMQADEGGPRSSRQLLALGIDSAADEAPACCLAGPGWMGPRQLGTTRRSRSKLSARHADPLGQQRFVERLHRGQVRPGPATRLD